ncbi:MAG: DNA polymerase III epsilon subunit DnaQ [Bacteroidetes bacterium HLUCCA01]|nr:MAG: DNA polymerase III epsilon subunit DnaQ [Bacteroidetes bacterium HLUCCA01]
MHVRQSYLLTAAVLALLLVVASQVVWWFFLYDADSGRAAGDWFPTVVIGVVLTMGAVLTLAWLGYRYYFRDLYRVSDELTLARYRHQSRIGDAMLPPVRSIVAGLNQVLGENHQLRSRHSETRGATAGDLAPRASSLRTASFVVFDTETTGLHPAGGDEIIAIGAVRIEQGVIVHDTHFDRLVYPGRSIPPESTVIHGIRDEDVAGAPTICAVLREFHAYCGQAVLVGHNVGFDMRFLKNKEKRCDLQFGPVALDTLLLSSALMPHLDRHDLDTLAERFNVPFTRRHTALGDALATASVFLHLMELAGDAGVHTVQDVLKKSRESVYAGLDY